MTLQKPTNNEYMNMSTLFHELITKLKFWQVKIRAPINSNKCPIRPRVHIVGWVQLTCNVEYEHAIIKFKVN